MVLFGMDCCWLNLLSFRFSCFCFRNCGCFFFFYFLFFCGLGLLRWMLILIMVNNIGLFLFIIFYNRLLFHSPYSLFLRSRLYSNLLSHSESHFLFLILFLLLNIFIKFTSVFLNWLSFTIVFYRHDKFYSTYIFLWMLIELLKVRMLKSLICS